MKLNSIIKREDHNRKGEKEMKKRISFWSDSFKQEQYPRLIFLLLVLFITSIATSQISNASENSVPMKNPGFEEGKAPAVSGWINQAPDMYKKDETVSHLGKASLKLSKSDPAIHKFIYQKIPLQPGKRYEITFWAKCENVVAGPKGAGLNCYFESRGGAFYPPGLSGTFDWQKITLTMKKPFGPKLDPQRSIISFGIFKGATGTAWVDDAEVVEIGEQKPSVEEPVKEKPQAAIPARGNIVLNPGFEEESKMVAERGQPLNWRGREWASRSPTGQWSTDQVHAGGRSVSLDIEKSFWQQVYLEQRISEFKGQPYIFSVWAKTEKPGQKYSIYMESHKLDGSWGKAAYAPDYEGSGKWEQRVLSLNLPDYPCKSLYIVLQLKSPGKVWFDEVYFGELPGKGAPSPAPPKETRDELIHNGNFEKDSNADHIPDHWRPIGKGASWVTDRVLSGQHSVKLENDKEGTGPYWRQDNIPIVQGKKYILTVNVKAKEFGQEYSFYAESNQQGVWWTSPKSGWRQGFPDWQRKSVEFTVNKPQISKVYVILRVKGKATIWFDEVSLHLKEEVEEKESVSLLNLEIIRPYYRQAIYAPQSLAKIELMLSISDKANLEDKSIEVVLKKMEKY